MYFHNVFSLFMWINIRPLDTTFRSVKVNLVSSVTGYYLWYWEAILYYRSISTISFQIQSTKRSLFVRFSCHSTHSSTYLRGQTFIWWIVTHFFLALKVIVNLSNDFIKGSISVLTFYQNTFLVLLILI